MRLEYGFQLAEVDVPCFAVEAVEGVKIGSKIVIDGTRTIPEVEFSLPPKETMMKALETWKSAGLPEFDIPMRAQLRIDKS